MEGAAFSPRGKTDSVAAPEDPDFNSSPLGIGSAKNTQKTGVNPEFTINLQRDRRGRATFGLSVCIMANVRQIGGGQRSRGSKLRGDEPCPVDLVMEIGP